MFTLFFALLSVTFAQVSTGQTSSVSTFQTTGTTPASISTYFQVLGNGVDTYFAFPAGTQYTVNYYDVADCAAVAVASVSNVPTLSNNKNSTSLHKRQTFGEPVFTQFITGARAILSADYVFTVPGQPTLEVPCAAVLAVADFTTTTATTTTAIVTSGTATISGTATDTVVISQTNTVVVSGSSTITTITPSSTTSAAAASGTTINVNVNVTVSIGNYKPCASCQQVSVHPCGFDGSLKCFAHKECPVCAVVYKVCPLDAVIEAIPPTVIPACVGVHCPVPVAQCINCPIPAAPTPAAQPVANACVGVQCPKVQAVQPCVGVACPPAGKPVLQVSSSVRSFAVSMIAVIAAFML